MPVQLHVQLPCNMRAGSVAASPRLPISKPHACTRAARLLHGIGSWQGWIDLVARVHALRIEIQRPAVLATARHTSRITENACVSGLTCPSRPSWEAHGKIANRPDEYQRAPRLMVGRCHNPHHPIDIACQIDLGGGAVGVAGSSPLQSYLLRLFRGSSSPNLAATRVLNLGQR